MNRLLIFIFLSLSLGQSVAAQTPPLIVWPGDATNNGVVNNVDFLQLGLAYNFFGPERSSMNVQWAPQPATAWNLQFGNGLNLAYADCNGDGIVNYNYDAFPIYVHYGNTHGQVAPDVFAPGVPGVDATLGFDHLAANDSVQKGARLSIPILLGSPEIPAEDLYGLAFSIFYEPAFADLEQVNLSELSWANPDNDRITSVYPVSNNPATGGRVDVAWVRTDRNERSGHGRIGKVDFIIIDDVVGQFSSFQLRIGDIRMIDKFGNETAIAGDTLTITVLPDALSDGGDPQSLRPKLRTFPNPASDQVTLQAESIIENVVVLSALGQPLRTELPGKNTCSLPLGDLPPGIYFLQVRTRDGIFVEKIEVR